MTNFTRLYAESEKRISTLLEDARLPLSASDRDEVTEFLEAGEYGLALESLACALPEGARQVDRSAIAEIAGLARDMRIQDWPFMSRLAKVA